MGDKAALQHIRQYYNNLAPMSDKMWAEFSQMLRMRHLQVGECLLQEGQVCDFVAFVHTGLLRTITNNDGNEIIICFTEEGQYISSYPSFLTGEPADARIEAMEPTTAVLLFKKDMETLYRQEPASNLWGRLVEEKVFLQSAQRVRALHTLSPEEHYKQLTDTQPELLQRIPQYMIASYIGITPEALSRIRRRLSAPRGSTVPSTPSRAKE